MAKFDVLDMNGKKVSTVELSDAVFGITPNEKVMHAAVVNFLANQRQGTQSTKTRSEVSGGGRKPWRQKGTGRARQGSTRSSAVDAWRCSAGPQAPRLQLPPEQEGQASGAAVCFEQQGPERRHDRHRRAEGRRVQDQDRREHAHGHRRRQEGAHRHPGCGRRSS